MSITNIRQSGRVFETKRELFYHPVGDNSGGYSYDIDEDGHFVRNDYWDYKPDEEWVLHLARIITRSVLLDNDPEWVKDIRVYEASYWEPSMWICHCGEEIYGNGPGDDFGCDNCHRDYNAFGQELAPREQWGYETGEHYVDIVNARNSNDVY